MSQRLLACVLLALAVLPAAARSAEEPKRGAYVVKYAAAEDLAALLAKHFKGAAEIQAGPEGTSNCLLIKAPPAVFDELLKTLEKLDRRPHAVAVEVFVVQLPAKKADDKDKGPDDSDFSGPIDEVAGRLDRLLKRGEVFAVKRAKLATLEGQPGSLMLGENKAFPLGSGQIAYRNVGTQVKVTPRVADDGSVTLDLSVQDSRGRESATVAGTTEFILTTLSGKVSVASGKVVLAKDAQVISKEGKGETLILVGARVAKPEGKAK
jgi:hypothetical protein